MEIPLDQLSPHPHNSNAMPRELFEKLVAHIEQSNRYPPIIVRPHEGGYQILDGHHRVEALRQLGRTTTAACEVWDVDEDEALLLLATLNRLEGRDDPKKRAALIQHLHDRLNIEQLAARLPERLSDIQAQLQIVKPPVLNKPQRSKDMPVAVHFFLLPKQRDALEAKLRETGANREAALLRLLEIDDVSLKCIEST
jgi:hypothetical protein